MATLIELIVPVVIEVVRPTFLTPRPTDHCGLNLYTRVGLMSMVSQAE